MYWSDAGFFMVINMGIIPALKYMVITTKRYQNFLPHIRSWVNINPINADASTERAVPRTVLATEITAALKIPFNF